MMARCPGPGVMGACAIILVVAGFAAVHAGTDAGTYFALVGTLHREAWNYPFLDVETILTWMECHRAGVDVIVRNPCELSGRTMAYPPIWLRLAFTGVDTGWTQILGLGSALIFAAAVAALPLPRGGLPTVMVVMAAISPPVLFGLERGNPDLLVFALVVLAVRVSGAAPGGLAVRYAALLLTGLLKLYPVTLLILAAREGLARLVVIVAASALVLGAYLAVEGADLLRVMRGSGIPSGSGNWFGTMIGAANLPHGLAAMAPRWLGAPGWVQVGLFGGFLGLAALLLGWGRLAARLAPLPERESLLLLAGSVMLLACFFAGQSVAYRLIHLLLVLPALMRLMRGGDRLAMLGCGLVLGVLWSFAVPLPLSVSAFNAAHLAIWLAQQLAWWGLNAVFLAVVLAQLWTSPALGTVLAGLQGWVRSRRG